MCGIVYSKSFNGISVIPTIVTRYTAQRHRGSNGFGFYVPEKDRLTHNVKEGRILSLLRREKKAEEVLFHHRFPTSTANVRNACHPFSTKQVFENNYVVVHNGVLRNEHELKKEHDALGINYVSVQESGRFNDSEALAYDIGRYLEGQQDKIKAKGSIAFIAIKRDSAGKPVTLFFGRNNGNPLRMKKTKYSLTLSSEGEGELIDANKVYAFSYDTYELTSRPCTIETGYTTYTGNYGNYASPHRPAATPQVVTPKGFGVGDDDDDDDLRSLRNSWDSLDVSDEDKKWADMSEIKEYVQAFLEEADHDTGVAVGLAQVKLSQLEARQMRLDLMSQDEEMETQITDAEINEFVGNEDEIVYVEEAIKQLRKKLTAEVIEGETVRKPIGFRPQDYTQPNPATPVTTPITTGVRHPVPTRPSTTKAIGSGLPYAD